MTTLRVRSLVAVISLVVFAASVATAHGPAGSTTYSKHVALIFYKRCVVCHRPGTTAPMSLLTYKDARPWARAIREKVVAREMPPWNADPHYGKFKNDPHLTDVEIDAIKDWADGGAPEGNPKDLPPAPAVAEGWLAGKPDLVMEMNEDFAVPGDKELDMQYFKLDTFSEDKWIRSAEVLPGNTGVVHHADIYIMPPPGEKIPEGKAGRPGGEGGLVTMPPSQFRKRTAPYKGTPIEQAMGVVELRGTESVGGVGHGGANEGYPRGTGKLIKAGSTVYLQVHYHPDGQEEKDRSKVGFIFLKEPPEREIRDIGVVNMNFDVPAGASDYEVKSEATFQKDVHLWSLRPHMHLRGKDMKYTLVYPDGRSEVLLFVPKYDFYTQRDYELAVPKAMPKGSKLVVTAHMDNSADNKLLKPEDYKNPVSRGIQTSDEMMNGHIRITVDDAVIVARKGGSAPSAGGPPNNDQR